MNRFATIGRIESKEIKHGIFRIVKQSGTMG